MNPDPDTAIVLAHLDTYRPNHPTVLLAVEACVLAHVPGADKLSHDERWIRYVKPVQLELATRDLRTHTRAGRPIRATLDGVPQPKQAAASGKLTLDCRGYAGENKTLRLMTFVRSQPGCENLSHEAAHLKACELSQTHEVL